MLTKVWIRLHRIHVTLNSRKQLIHWNALLIFGGILKQKINKTPSFQKRNTQFWMNQHVKIAKQRGYRVMRANSVPSAPQLPRFEFSSCIKRYIGAAYSNKNIPPVATFCPKALSIRGALSERHFQVLFTETERGRERKEEKKNYLRGNQLEKEKGQWSERDKAQRPRCRWHAITMELEILREYI